MYPKWKISRAPATPLTNALSPKANSLKGTGSMPAARASVSFSRIAASARPMRERRMKKKRTSTRMATRRTV